jgi:GNAT superfamily N-acetyltransferase
LRAPGPGDFGWVVARHGAIYADEFGWDATFEALVARIVADYVDQHEATQEAAWIATIDGDNAGCVFCVRKDNATAQLRLLLVEPDARGRGVGSLLVTACIDFARRAGYQRITLWTNDVLVAARRIYEAAGFRLIDEAPHSSFGVDLVGQNWQLEL